MIIQIDYGKKIKILLIQHLIVIITIKEILKFHIKYLKKDIYSDGTIRI